MSEGGGGNGGRGWELHLSCRSQRLTCECLFLPIRNIQNLRQDIAERDEELEVLRAEIEAVLKEGLSTVSVSRSGGLEIQTKTSRLLVLASSKIVVVALVSLLLLQLVVYFLFAAGDEPRRLYSVLGIGSMTPGPN